MEALLGQALLAIRGGSLIPQHMGSEDGSQSPLLSSLGPHFAYSDQCAFDAPHRAPLVANGAGGERKCLQKARIALHLSVVGASDPSHLERLMAYPVFSCLALYTLGLSATPYEELRSLEAADHWQPDEFLTWKEAKFWEEVRASVVQNRVIEDEYVQHTIACEMHVPTEDLEGMAQVWLVRKRFTELKEFHQAVSKLLPDLEVKFPGKTFVPGKWKKPATMIKRQVAFDRYLSDILAWLRAALDDDEQQATCTSIIELLVGLLGDPKRFLGRPLRNASTAFASPVLRDGWYRQLAMPELPVASNEEGGEPASVRDPIDVHLGLEAVNCESLVVACQVRPSIRGIHLQGSRESQEGNEGLAALLQYLASADCQVERLSLDGFEAAMPVHDDMLGFLKENVSLVQLSVVGGMPGYPTRGVVQPGVLLNALRIPTLQSLNLSGALGEVPLPEEDLQLITDWLVRDGQLRELWLDGTFVGDEGARHLAVALATNQKLERLSLRQSQVGPDGLIELASSLKHNGCLKVLHVVDRPHVLPNRSAQVKDVAKALAEMLSSNSALEELDITGQYLSDHVIGLAAAAAQNKVLRKLSLGNNRCYAAPVLAAILSSESCLTSLDLSSNDLADLEDLDGLTEGWLASLVAATNLAELHLPWLNVPSLVGPLLQALAKTSIKKLVFSSAIEKEQMDDLQALLGDCLELRALHVRSPSKGLYEVHDALVRAAHLEALHMHCSAIEAHAFLDRLEASDSRHLRRLLFSLEEAGPQFDVTHRADTLMAR